MARKPRTAKGRVMKPNFFVFCEGETEVAYVDILRSQYRLAIHVIAKKTLLNVTPSMVERCKAAYIQTKNDRTFLMYDLDVPTMLDKLKRVPESTLLCSNPCFEIWLLLHVKDHKSTIDSEEVIKELRNSTSVWKDYKKPSFTKAQKDFLISNTDNAVRRAKELIELQNPSTTVFKLIEILRDYHLSQP